MRIRTSPGCNGRGATSSTRTSCFPYKTAAFTGVVYGQKRPQAEAFFIWQARIQCRVQRLLRKSLGANKSAPTVRLGQNRTGQPPGAPKRLLVGRRLENPQNDSGPLDQ